MQIGIDASTITLKRVKIRIPYLTMGIHDLIEKNLGMIPGRVVLLSSKGDLDLVLIILSKLIARGSLVEWPDDARRKTRVMFAYPILFDNLDFFMSMVKRNIETSGIESMIDISYRPIKNLDDQIATIDESRGMDICMYYYVDHYFKETSDFVAFMNEMNVMKEGKIMILNRFDKKRKSLADRSDVKIYIIASKFAQNNSPRRTTPAYIGKIDIKDENGMDMSCRVMSPKNDVQFAYSKCLEKVVENPGTSDVPE